MHLKVYSGSFPFSSNPVPPRAAEPEFIDTSGTSDSPLCTSSDNPGKDWIKLCQINFVNRSGVAPKYWWWSWAILTCDSKFHSTYIMETVSPELFPSKWFSSVMRWKLDTNLFPSILANGHISYLWLKTKEHSHYLMVKIVSPEPWPNTWFPTVMKWWLSYFPAGRYPPERHHMSPDQTFRQLGSWSQRSSWTNRSL